MSEVTSMSLDRGWYADPYGSALSRYHDGNAWTGRLRVPGTVEEFVEPEVRMRPAAVRGFVTTIAVVGWVAVYFFPVILVSLVGSPVAAVSFAVWGAWMLFVGLAGPRVGYNPAFMLVLFVPVAGFFLTLYVTAKIVSRLLVLPYRTWEVSSTEADAWVRIRNPKQPDSPLYVRRH
jgi:hypothetical protein